MAFRNGLRLPRYAVVHMGLCNQPDMTIRSLLAFTRRSIMRAGTAINEGRTSVANAAGDVTTGPVTLCRQFIARYITHLLRQRRSTEHQRDAGTRWATATYPRVRSARAADAVGGGANRWAHPPGFHMWVVPKGRLYLRT